ncbi:MAG TPA: hypothetical protein VK835_05680 [Bacteroidia bacterium]|jgi:hypothetical protein|nr:hypothetical protein [Bacteroidia bacterium]
MKKTKKISIILTLFVICMMPLVQGCKKYPDGPLISFRSRAERVANTWRVDNYQKNGTDYTSLMAGYTETYTRDGGYSYSWGNVSGTGVWMFQNSDKEIALTGLKNQENHTLVVLKLEEKEFWYYYISGNDRHEFHMIQN